MDENLPRSYNVHFYVSDAFGTLTKSQGDLYKWAGF